MKPRKLCFLIYLTLFFCSRFLFADDPSEADKLYDAFVSYANEDREFVEDYLVPGLEKGDTLSYKCCVHYRDFVVGRQVR